MCLQCWLRPYDHHAVVIVDRAGLIVADFEIEHNASGWQRWREQVAALGPGVAACVETSQGVVIEQLLESGVSLYPISPVSSQAYRERKAPSGNKTDHVDAWSLADALRVDGHGWRTLAKEDPLCRTAAALPRRGGLNRERTALVNQLQSALHEYYPAALEAFEDWTLPAPGLLSKPSPLLRRSPRQGNANGKSSSTAISLSGRKPMPNAWKSSRGERVRLWRSAHPHQEPTGADLHADAALQNQIEAYRAEIEKLFAQQPDHDLFGSLPGAGPKIAPRLLSEINSIPSALILTVCSAWPARRR